MNLDLRFYLQRFWRRFPWFVIIAAVVSAVGITLAVVLPPSYRAQAQLLVESPSIPTDLAASTVATGAPEALQIIQQRLLARANLLDMAQRLAIYDGQALMTPDKIVEDLRRRTTISVPSGKSAADFVTVSFAAPGAQLSAQVTNDLVTQILQENVSLRTATAGQTLDFFEQEVDRLGTELGQLGSKIMVFKSARKDALPDSLDFRRTRQAQQQERLLQLDREISALKERRDRLTEIYQATGNVGRQAAPATPEEAQLREAQNQLNSAMTLYSPQHPTIVALKARVAALEAVVNAQAGVVPEADGTTPRESDASIAFRLQIADIDSQIAFDTDQKAQIEAELAALKVTIEATPGNAIELDALQRDYDNAQTQYNNAVARLGQAQTGDRIEALSKGQRITVIEQAVVPNEPASPNRQLIAMGSVLGGLALGLAFVFLIEVMNRAVHRPADLASKLGIQALATVPYIYTRGEVFRRRMVLVSVVLVAVLGIPAALFAVHQYYLPLDLLIGRVLDKI
jgi:polysaccharide chain length determinant protein (PEP-CTERM system associated)